MKIYKKNLGFFINASFWIMAIFNDPIWEMIKYMGPIALTLPIAFGAILGYWESNIDWELI